VTITMPARIPTLAKMEPVKVQISTSPLQCHSSNGFCTPSGECYYPLREDGSGCDDGNPCTINDVCTAGTCQGREVVCEAPDQCHQFGACNVETGKCEYAMLKTEKFAMTEMHVLRWMNVKTEFVLEPISWKTL
jgi:hypothetical protein